MEEFKQASYAKEKLVRMRQKIMADDKLSEEHRALLLKKVAQMEAELDGSMKAIEQINQMTQVPAKPLDEEDYLFNKTPPNQLEMSQPQRHTPRREPLHRSPPAPVTTQSLSSGDDIYEERSNRKRENLLERVRQLKKDLKEGEE